MKEFRIKDCFICNFCRNICQGNCFDQLIRIKNGTVKENTEEYEKNEDLIGRKNIIECLGPYCDRPCKLQKNEFTPFGNEDGLKPLFEAISFLGEKVNNLIEENNRLANR